MDVLKLLKARKNRGISFKDFPKGFRLASRIFDLRERGVGIITQREDGYARYTILPLKRPIS
jgi:hypothetical protein